MDKYLYFLLKMVTLKYSFLSCHVPCGSTLKRVREMLRTYSQMQRTDKYSQHSSIIWLVWLDG